MCERQGVECGARTTMHSDLDNSSDGYTEIIQVFLFVTSKLI